MRIATSTHPTTRHWSLTRGGMTAKVSPNATLVFAISWLNTFNVTRGGKQRGSPLIMRSRFPRSPHSGQQGAEIVVRRGRVGVKSRCFGEASRGFFESTFGCQHRAQPDIGVGVVGVGVDRYAKMIDRHSTPALLCCEIAQQTMGRPQDPLFV